jgi:hypothetical protein
MAAARCTSRWRAQKINACCISALQGRLLPPDKEEDGHTRGHLFCFSLSSFLILPLYHDCNLSPPLRNYKRGGMERAQKGTRRRRTTTHLMNTYTHLISTEETWDPFPLSKACNPYYEHSGARQHEQQQNPLDVGSFMPEPVYILVSALHTIRAEMRRYKFTRRSI